MATEQGPGKGPAPKPDSTGASAGGRIDPATQADADLSARLDTLGDRLTRMRAETGPPAAGPQRNTSNLSGLGYALRLSTELFAGTIAGGLLGWIFDHLAGTSPIGLAVFLLVGFCAGLLNLLRAAGMVKQPDFRRGAEPPGDDPGAR